MQNQAPGSIPNVHTKSNCRPRRRMDRTIGAREGVDRLYNLLLIVPRDAESCLVHNVKPGKGNPARHQNQRRKNDHIEFTAGQRFLGRKQNI
jgi:hypothetical protein